MTRRGYGAARWVSLLVMAAVLAGTGAAAVAEEPGSSGARTGDEAAVLAVVGALFDGMRAKDGDLIRSQFADGARLGNLSTDDFVSRVTGSDALLDEVTFDEIVLIDDDLAMAWTPYNLFIDGALHHCGVDLFTMRRSSGRWLIAHLEDTRGTEGCDPTRR